MKFIIEQNTSSGPLVSIVEADSFTVVGIDSVALFTRGEKAPNHAYAPTSNMAFFSKVARITPLEVME